MSTRIAINGFGRIGRNAFKIAYERHDCEIVAMNDVADTKTLAYLLKHDTHYGVYAHNVDCDETHIIVDSTPIAVFSEPDPAKLPWRKQNIDVVIECTGQFDDPEKAQAHIAAGAKHVVISAPVAGEGADTIILGVNDEAITSGSSITSNGSDITNCVAPVMAILDKAFGIEKAMTTTIHSDTAGQRLQNAPARSLRESRAAAENIVPIAPDVAPSLAKVLPTLHNKFGSLAIQVPTPVVSMSDCVVLLQRDVTIADVNNAFQAAANEPFYQGILAVTDEELVSSDFKGNSHSCIIDLPLTNVVDGNLVKVVAWYDNEWGYANRLVETVVDAGLRAASDA